MMDDEESAIIDERSQIDGDANPELCGDFAP
jgi:hypothetical protein